MTTDHPTAASVSGAQEPTLAVVDLFLEWLKQAAKMFAMGAESISEHRAGGALDLALALRANRNAGLTPTWLIEGIDAFAARAVAAERASRQSMSEEDAERVQRIKFDRKKSGRPEYQQGDVEFLLDLLDTSAEHPQPDNLGQPRSEWAAENLRREEQAERNEEIVRAVEAHVSQRRAQPDASDLERACRFLGEPLIYGRNGKPIISPRAKQLAATLAEARRAEREKCAQICEDRSNKLGAIERYWVRTEEAQNCAAAIRALPNTETQR